MSQAHRSRGVLSWARARQIAASAAEPLPVVRARLSEAVGSMLARPIEALTDLPAFDSSAMDGWAVAGPAPWDIVGDVRPGHEFGKLISGQAVTITTGGAMPQGADAVLRSELGASAGPRLLAIDPLTGLADPMYAPPSGAEIRRTGEECRLGDRLVDPGIPVTPAIVGLAAAAGHDDLGVIRPPVVALLVTGDELLDHGLPRPGRVRDALGPMLPAWIAALPARANPPIHVTDSRDALRAEIEDAAADVIVTTGATAASSVDHLHEVLDQLHARWLVDGVAVRPGHPMLLARLGDGRFVLGLPGNPLAAVSGLLTLGAPLLRALAGRAHDNDPRHARLASDVRAHPEDARLVPVVVEARGESPAVAPLRFTGPAMLRGLALAEALAVIPPGEGRRDSRVEILPLLGD